MVENTEKTVWWGSCHLYKYIKDSMEYSVRTDLVTFNEYRESIFIEIDTEYTNAKKNIVIGIIYRTPNTNMMDFNTTPASVLEQLRVEDKLVYLMSNYNIDLLNSESHDLTNAFMDVMYCNEFLPLISLPQESLIDLLPSLIIYSRITMMVWIVHSMVFWWLMSLTTLTTSQFPKWTDPLQWR